MSTPDQTLAAVTPEPPAAHPDGPVLVVLQDADGTLGRTDAEVLALARPLGGGAPVVAVSHAAEPALAEIGAAGATSVVHPGPVDAAGSDALRAGLTAGVPGVLADVVEAAVGEVAPRFVLLAASPLATDVAGTLAVRLDSAAVVDAATLTPGAEGLEITRQVLDASWSTTCALTRGVPVVTVQAGAVVGGNGPDAAPAAAVTGTGEPESRELPVTLGEAAAAVRVVEHHVHESGSDIPLAGAEIVVVAGRGVGQDLAIARELAAELGAALGATRVVTEQGWAPRELQIGQSGVVVAPRLYLGLGVSGQFHHVHGIRGSQYIVAVCDDPDAPIFEMADLGVVGDVYEVVPQLLAELRGGN